MMGKENQVPGDQVVCPWARQTTLVQPPFSLTWQAGSSHLSLPNWSSSSAAITTTSLFSLVWHFSWLSTSPGTSKVVTSIVTSSSYCIPCSLRTLRTTSCILTVVLHMQYTNTFHRGKSPQCTHQGHTLHMWVFSVLHLVPPMHCYNRMTIVLPCRHKVTFVLLFGHCVTFLLILIDNLQPLSWSPNYGICISPNSILHLHRWVLYKGGHHLWAGTANRSLIISGKSLSIASTHQVCQSWLCLW